MMPDTAAPTTRRALLAAALGAAAATVASAIGRPLPARAADGQAVLLGRDNAATEETRVTSSGFLTTAIFGEGQGIGVWGKSEGLAGLRGWSNAAIGVYGTSSSNYGVAGESTSHYGIIGDSHATDRAAIVGRSFGGATAVHGVSGTGNGSVGFPLAKAKTGVYGEANQDTSARGVWGNSPLGRGVFGQATSGIGVRGYATSGVGLSGEATTGYALRTTGRVRFDTASGVATIHAGKSSVTVSPALNLTTSSFVVLAPRANLGGRALWHTVDPTADSFTIRVSSAVGSNVAIAWLLIG